MAGHVDAVALNRAVDRCFEAAIDPDLWPGVLQALADATSSTGAVIFRFGEQDRGSFLCSGACAEAMDEYLASEWPDLNPRLGNPPNERIWTDADFMRDERQTRAATVFREGFLRKHDMGWFAGTSLFRDRHRQVLVSIERRMRHTDFDVEELRLLDDAFQRVRRAIALVPELDGRLRTAMLDGFEATGQATVVLDAGGALLQVNPAAEPLIAQVFRVRHGRLEAADRLDGAAWNAFLARLLASMRGASIGPDPLVLAARDGAGIRVRGSALHPRAGDLFRGMAALVFLDPLRPAAIAADTLRAAFGLTPCQARLASALSGSFDLKQAGTAVGIGYETARSHLKAILTKSGAGSQKELAAMFALLR